VRRAPSFERLGSAMQLAKLEAEKAGFWGAKSRHEWPWELRPSKTVSPVGSSSASDSTE
jgi:hypothetical protein